MDGNLKIKNDLAILAHELEITTSRAGGPGGQHVNKTNSRVSVRWNVLVTQILSAEQKARVLEKLAGKITSEGDLIVHNSASRSQLQNKEAALMNLASLVRKALHVPKKRMKTKLPKTAKEARLQAKSHHSNIKKLRSKKLTSE